MRFSMRRHGSGRIGRILAVGWLALGLAGCALDEAPPPPNIPPLTHLDVRGDTLHVTSYHTILNWWGTDRDGLVIGYAYRWDGPWHPAPEDSLWWEDTTWTFTKAGTDTFDVPIGGAYAERTFHVCAIDDDRAADPTPEIQRFPLENAPPIVEWTDPTRHPTLQHPSLPAVSFAWTPEDYDGRETIAYARLWLDTAAGEDPQAATITVVGDTVGAFFPESFQGRYGERTVHLQVFDRAETGSDTISWTWRVVEPAGDYLLIDNAGGPPTGPQRTDDAFWRARMETVAPGNFHVYDVAVDGAFRSAQEVLPLFSLFRGVVWYGGVNFDGSTASDAAMRTGLERAQGSLMDYVSSGHSILITGHNLVGTGGGLSRAFWQDLFGIEKVYTHLVEEEYTSDFMLPKSVSARCGALLGATDSLRTNAPIKAADLFWPSSALEPILWFAPGTLDTTLIPEHATSPVYVGAAAQWGSGRLVLCTTVLTRFAPGPGADPIAAVDHLLQGLFLTP